MSLAATVTCNNAYAPGNVCPTEWVDSGGEGNLSIHDDLFDDVNPSTYKGSGNTQVISQFTTNPQLHDVDINHVTVITTNTNILSIYADPTNPQPKMGPFTFTNSIVMAGQYGGIWSSGGTNPCVVTQNPIVTFDQCFTTTTVTNNAIIGWTTTKWKPWPAGNSYPATPQDIFVNFLPFGGDYHVQAAYKGAATDGKDIGADIDTITNLLANVN
jgi:hypothetical protein